MSHLATKPRQHDPALIRSAREGAGFTREAAAFLAGVSVAAVQDAERGRDSRGSTLAALARLYGVSIDSFFIHDPEADTASTARGERIAQDNRARSGDSPVTAGTGAAKGSVAR